MCQRTCVCSCTVCICNHRHMKHNDWFWLWIFNLFLHVKYKRYQFSGQEKTKTSMHLWQRLYLWNLSCFLHFKENPFKWSCGKFQVALLKLRKKGAAVPFLLHQKHTVDAFPIMKKSSLTGIIWKVEVLEVAGYAIFYIFSTIDEHSPLFLNLIIPICIVFFFHHSRAVIYSM